MRIAKEMAAEGFLAIALTGYAALAAPLCWNWRLFTDVTTCIAISRHGG